MKQKIVNMLKEYCNTHGTPVSYNMKNLTEGEKYTFYGIQIERNSWVITLNELITKIESLEE